MNKLHIEQLWDDLNQQPVHRFADWPNKEVPKGKPGAVIAPLFEQFNIWVEQ